MKKNGTEKPKRFARYPSQSTRDTSESVPKLRYGANSNLATFKQKMVVAAMEKYGNLARLLELDEYYEPDPIELSDYDKRTDPLGIQLDRMKNKIKTRDRLISEMENNRTPFYGYMLRHLSNESLDAIKLLDEYEQINREKDPLLLWRAIKKTHKVATNSNVERVRKAETRRKYQEAKQGPYESIVSYKERFDYLLEAYKDVGNAEMEESDIAMDFFEGLDDTRYGEFKTNYLNDLMMGTQSAPDHVNDVYVKASKFMSHNRTQKSGGGSSFMSRSKNNKGKKSGDRDDTAEQRRKNDTESKGSNRAQKKKPLICWSCGEPGHRMNECPASSDQEPENRKCTTTMLNAFTSGSEPFQWYEVLLDNQADVSVVHPRLLTNVRPATRGCSVAGLSGHELELPNVGELDQFFTCKTADELRASVLCQADVEDIYDVTYKQGESFTVHLPNSDLTFYRRNKMYVADMRDWATAHANVTTVAEREAQYSKVEVARAREARDLVRNSGFDSERDAVSLVSDGNITGVRLTPRDIRRAFDIYGKPFEAVRGKTTSKKVSRQYVDTALKAEQQKEQRLYTDIFNVRQQPFMLTLAEPMGLTIVAALENETTDQLGLALQEHVNLLRSYGYIPTIAYLDPQPGFKALRGKITGVEIDIAGAGDHLDKIDGKIRRIKETIRSVNAGLPWNLPDANVKDLVRYSNSRMNLRRPSTNGSAVAPRVALTGRKPDYKKELSLAFGDYVECYDPKTKSNNAEQSRTEPCIALYPTGNANGSWIFLNMKTNKYISRTNWRKMITTQIVIDAVNRITSLQSNGKKSNSPAGNNDDEGRVTKYSESALQAETGENDMTEAPREPDKNEQDDTTEIPELVDDHDDGDDDGGNDKGVHGQESSVGASLQQGKEESPATSSSHAPGDTGESEITGVVNNTYKVPLPAKGQSGRRAAGALRKPVMYRAYHTSVTQGLREHGNEAYLAIVQELKQLLHHKKAIVPVHKSELSRTQLKRTIRSLMFLKTKYDGLGRFEKIKARLVANGAQQDRKLYTDTSSPTVALQSVFTCLAIAAKEGRHISTVDIGGAYLNAEMTGEEVIMELEPMLATIMKKLDPSIQPFIDERGRLLVRLDKALYGCVQSARLWYNTIRAYLESIGFVANTVDQCVFNRTANGNQCTVTLHVDDLLVMSQDKSDTVWLVEQLKKQYGEVKYCDDSDMSYIGMHVSVADGKAVISMKAYLDGVLEEAAVAGRAASPATSSLFSQSETQKLSRKETASFHSVVAKLLYLATRVRPDILLSVAYLATKVKSPTHEDQQKVERVLKYLAQTSDKVLHLRIGEEMSVRCFIDASFALHTDGKGHTGVVIQVGGATVLCRSTKQRIVTKDSTESELVGLSDMFACAMKIHEFICAQGYKLDPPVVFQDNISNISLVTKGGGKYRSKYMRVRQALVKEQHDNGCIKLEYLPTGKMLADVLTKPLQGELFRYLTCCIAGSGYSCHRGAKKNTAQ